MKLYLYLQPTRRSGCRLADVIWSIWMQKRSRSSSTRTTGRVEMDERCRSFVAMWALSVRGLGKKWMTTHIVCCTTKKAKRRSRGGGDRWEIAEGIKEGSISASLFPNGSLSRWPMDCRTTATSPSFCWIGEWVYPPWGQWIFEESGGFKFAHAHMWGEYCAIGLWSAETNLWIGNVCGPNPGKFTFKKKWKWTWSI